MTLRIYNTLSHREEEFLPLEAGSFSMYNCGPTVYGDPHIGNFRAFLMGDLLRRYFDLHGAKVKQVMNITDVGHLTTDSLADAQGEDKLEKSAREQGLDPWQIARHYESIFFEDLDELRLRRAHAYPRATEHIPEMVEMIAALVRDGYAYEVDGVGVYFRVLRFSEYGVLSGNTLDALDPGARVSVDERKESPLDFALWKIDPKHLMQWDSPWGRGFPGWHIECSAMSRKYLGDTFDLHTGGEDNIFPHHECERAQSLCGTSGKFARYWMHARFLLVEGAKMAKSAGNFITIRNLLEEGFRGPEIRYALISSHYRQQANFTREDLRGHRRAVDRLREFRGRLERIVREGEAGQARPALSAQVAGWQASADRAFDEDLNVAGALGVLFEALKQSNRETLRRAEAELILAWLARLDQMLDVIFTARDEGPAGEELTEDERGWLAERAEARRSKNWRRADELRALLATRRIEVVDSPAGSTWKRRHSP